MSNETVVNTAAQQEHMPDYKRTLGFWDLFSISVGIIVGSGVLVFTGRGIAQTGRSVCLAYLGAAVWVVCTAIPTFLMCSCIRLIGGAYTQCNLFLGEKWGGFYLCLYFLSQMGLNLYAQTFALYFCELFGGGNEKLVAAIMITFFYVLNFFGVDFMSKAQNIMSAILLLALIWFTVRGLPRVDWANFFGGEGWMTNGWGGLFATSTLLTYSLMGRDLAHALLGNRQEPAARHPSGRRHFDLRHCHSVCAYGLSYAPAFCRLTRLPTRRWASSPTTS